MTKIPITLFFLILILLHVQLIYTHWTSYLSELVETVQTEHIYADSKTFVDAIPFNTSGPVNLDAILTNFYAWKDQQRDKPKDEKRRSLVNFIFSHFLLEFEFDFSNSTVHADSAYEIMESRIKALWKRLTRNPDTHGEHSTLIPLPYTYIVPGGRFREIYYWDSYFTSLCFQCLFTNFVGEGLAVHDRYDLIESMVKNFVYLQTTYNIIPNGNRIYYLTRSQPPVLAFMVNLLMEKYGLEYIQKYIPALEKELQYWNSQNKSVRLQFNNREYKLNRYFDTSTTPRPESYREDVETARESLDKPSLYRHLRSGAESGWDFSPRWLDKPENRILATTRTSDFIPIDLNALLYYYEEFLSRVFGQLAIRDHSEEFALKANFYKRAAENRREAINLFCWDPQEGFYFDFDLKTQKKRHTVYSMAAAVPLFVNLSSVFQAKQVIENLEKYLLHKYGFVTMVVKQPNILSFQWDTPNGWAPLQWFGVKGLLNYGYTELAKKAMMNWLNVVNRYFVKTQKFFEKYNVVDDRQAVDGEYDMQEGFGWTNGITAKFIHLLRKM